MNTKVIFRKTKRAWGNEIVAVFPDKAGDMNPYRTCAGYAHIGQHTVVSADFMQWTRPASPEEYKDLLSELISIGYDDLKIAKRVTQKDFESRKAQTNL